MPYVDLHCSDDYASIFYITNTARSNVSAFCPEKPSIIILHPLFLDSTWLHHQFGDPRLNSNYNMIAFDMRSCGKSTSRPTPRHDSWVEAADLAFCHQALHLPPCHVLALEGLSVNCALRFAVLFPEMCLSITLCNVPPPIELKWVITAYDELKDNWSSAQDLETFEHASKESAGFLVGLSCEPDLLDDLIEFWELNMPPARVLRVTETWNVLKNRSPLKSEILTSITQPVLLIQGEHNETCPKVHAEKLASQLTGAEGGAVLYTVKGGSGALSIVPGHASIVNKAFTNFLARLPHTGSELVQPDISTTERMKNALSTLASMVGDSTIALRDPMSSLSFSCLSQEVVQSQQIDINRYRNVKLNMFSPLGPDRRPIRRYSDRRAEHWFHGEKNGLSIAEYNFLPPERVKEDRDRVDKSTLSQESTAEVRIRRTTFNTTTVEKQVIKGSMAKVVGTGTATQIHRLVV